jgi:hypothetical protein
MFAGTRTEESRGFVCQSPGRHSAVSACKRLQEQRSVQLIKPQLKCSEDKELCASCLMNASNFSVYPQDPEAREPLTDEAAGPLLAGIKNALP